MNDINFQNYSISSQYSDIFLNDAQLSWFIGYSVNTKTLSTASHAFNSQAREIIINSLERSIRENSEIWEELSKH